MVVRYDGGVLLAQNGTFEVRGGSDVIYCFSDGKIALLKKCKDAESAEMYLDIIASGRDKVDIR